ncbi:Cardiolipin synthase [compost metagenome]
MRIYEYGPRMLHSKAFIADDRTCIVGTANFDHRSFRLNFELSMMYNDRKLTSELEAILREEFNSATEVRLNRHRPLWRERLPEAFARLASPLL